jgi:hypothetical protein
MPLYVRASAMEKLLGEIPWTFGRFLLACHQENLKKSSQP